jgi:hypothetical protein
MNLWVKLNPAFDSDDALDSFLNESQGLAVMFDAPQRYFFQDLPKFLIYALQMYVPNFGDTPQISYVVFGKLQKNDKTRFKPISKWRQRK